MVKNDHGVVLQGVPAPFLARIGDGAALFDPLGGIPGAMFFVKDADYRYVAMSRAIREAIGMAAEADVSGRTDFDLFPAVIARAYRQNDERVIRDGQTLLDEVHLSRTATGGVAFVYSSKWPLHDAAGGVIGLIGINRPYLAPGQLTGDDVGRLAPAVERILARFGERHTIADLANLCGLSPSHFVRLFRSRLRTTPHRFLEDVRMSNAMEWLRSTSRSIAEISTACGFYDQSAFGKSFRRATGTTPLAFRRKERERIQATPLHLLPGNFAQDRRQV